MRQLAISILLITLVFTGCLYLTGCSPAVVAGVSAAGAAGGGYVLYHTLQPVVTVILHEAGQEVAILTYRSLPSSINHAVAEDVLMASGDALIYLRTGNLPTADIVNQIITAKFQNINPVLLSELQAIASTVGKYVPSASVALTPDQIGYLIALIEGIRDGTNLWLANGNVQVNVKYTIRTREKSKLKAQDIGPVPWFYPMPTPESEAKCCQ